MLISRPTQIHTQLTEEILIRILEKIDKRKKKLKEDQDREDEKILK